MGDAVDKLIALAGTERVSGYTRRSSTGKTVHVSAYTRSPGDMSVDDLNAEINDLMDDDTPRGKNRQQQLFSELRKRGVKWTPKKGSAWERDQQRAVEPSLKEAVEDANNAVREAVAKPDWGRLRGEKALRKWFDLAVNDEDEGKRAASKLTDDELGAAITEQERRNADGAGQDGKANLEVLQQEQERRNKQDEKTADSIQEMTNGVTAKALQAVKKALEAVPVGGQITSGWGPNRRTFNRDENGWSEPGYGHVFEGKVRSHVERNGASLFSKRGGANVDYLGRIEAVKKR